jgi:hypothetical protein
MFMIYAGLFLGIVAALGLLAFLLGGGVGDLARRKTRATSGSSWSSRA